MRSFCQGVCPRAHVYFHQFFPSLPLLLPHFLLPACLSSPLPSPVSCCARKGKMDEAEVKGDGGKSIMPSFSYFSMANSYIICLVSNCSLSPLFCAWFKGGQSNL